MNKSLQKLLVKLAWACTLQSPACYFVHFRNERYSFSVYNFSKMMRYLTTSSQQKKDQKLMQTKLSSSQPLNLHTIQAFITTYLSTPKQSQYFLKNLKKLTLTPHAIINILIFLHSYLQISSEINEIVLIDLINFLLFQCSSFIQMEHFATSSMNEAQEKGMKSCFIKTEMSTRDEESVLSKEILIHNIAKIYIRYLLKIVSIHHEYKSIGKMQQHASHQVWMIINLMRSLSSLSSSFTIVGRYFAKEYTAVVVSIVEIMNKDVLIFNQSLSRYVSYHNIILSCSAGSSTKQIQQFVKMLNEISHLNETFFQVYLGKYFFALLQHIDQPEWINTNSSEFDTIFKIAESNGKCESEGKKESKLRERDRGIDRLDR